jgi:hypothetical protein
MMIFNWLFTRRWLKPAEHDRRCLIIAMCEAEDAPFTGDVAWVEHIISWTLRLGLDAAGFEVLKKRLERKVQHRQFEHPAVKDWVMNKCHFILYQQLK